MRSAKLTSALGSKEKRRHVRVKAKGVAAYLRLDAKMAGCVVEDISAGGLFIRTDRVVPVGTSISLDLVDSEAQKAMQVSGQVVGIILKEAATRRGVSQGLRVRFDRQSGATKEYLQRLLARLGAPQANAPVFYAVTGQPPKAKVKTEALPGGGLPVVRREPPSLAGQPPRRTDGSIGPPILRRAKADISSTNLAPPELDDGPRAFGDGDLPGTDTAMDPSVVDSEEDSLAPQRPDARTVMADVAAYRDRLTQEEGDVAGLRARIHELEQALSEREERISDLEAQVLQLQEQLAGQDAAAAEDPEPDDPTPVPARPRRR